MPLVPVILLICLTIGIVYFVYIKRKERELIEQVTPIYSWGTVGAQGGVGIIESWYQSQSHISRLVHPENKW